MALVGYASSDEEEEENDPPNLIKPAAAALALQPARPSDSDFSSGPPSQSRSETSLAAAAVGPLNPGGPRSRLDDADLTAVGLVRGPLLPAAAASPSAHSCSVDAADNEPPLSPYSAERSMVRKLTLPAVPNLNIPPSPPGSPLRETTRKFERFLELKRGGGGGRREGTHFNERLAESKAARSPGLCERLMAHVGIDDDPRAQYETGIPREVLGWDPAVFPEEAFRTRLRERYERARRERELEQASGRRTAVEFVPAIGTGAQEEE